MLKNSISFSRDRAPDFFAQFPPAPAVFLLRGGDASSEPYVSKTTNLRRRLQRLLAPQEGQSKRLNLRDRVDDIHYTLTGSDFESAFLLYKILRREFPKTYQKRLRLRPAPLVRLNLENEYPRAYVTTRLGRLGGKSIYYGPFRSRVAAEKFMNDSLDLFKMRRCTFDLNPDPRFPGCIYSEMKMCLAPCFKGCTDEQYAYEVSRVQAYFDSGGQSLLHEMETERDRLSSALDFEGAAQQHAKIVKLKGILGGRDELCGRLEQIDAMIVQPSEEAGSVALFRFRQAGCAGPENFAAEIEGESLERRIRDLLPRLAVEDKRSALQFSEELALLKRWYYRTHKTGEIVVAGLDGELSARRVAHAVSKVFRGEKETSEPAGSSESV